MKEFTRSKIRSSPWQLFGLAIAAMVLTAVFETATGALLVPVFDSFVFGP